MKPVDIADELGCCPGTVYLRLHEAGIPIKDKKKRRAKRYPKYCCALAGMKHMMGDSTYVVADSLGCSQTTARNLIEKSGVKLKTIVYRRKCPDCGTEFTTNRIDKKFCCSRCSERSYRKRYVKRHSTRRDNVLQRARTICKKTGAEYDCSVRLEKLIERDKNICHICGKPCNKNDLEYGSSGPTYPTIDHLLPLSDGGSHTWDNVALAHHQCNSKRSA